MPIADLPHALSDLPFAAWSVNADLVVDDVLGGADVPERLALAPGTSIPATHPLLAGILRQAVGGEHVRRRATLGDQQVLLDAHPRRDGSGGAIVLTLPLAPPEASRAALTSRQLEVLHLLCLGLTSREIAKRLWIAETTVENHLRAVYARLGVRTRSEAVSRAFRLGLVDPAELDAVDDVA